MTTEEFINTLIDRNIKFDINSMHQENVFLNLVEKMEATSYPEEDSNYPINELEREDDNIVASVNQIVSKKRDWKESYEGWKRIPSMSSLNIILSGYNVKLAEIGFKKRLPNKLEFVGTENNAMNMYIAYQIRQLKRLREDKQVLRYWKIVIYLLKNSVSFRTSAFNRVLPNWWHAISLDKVSHICNKVEKIFNPEGNESLFDTMLQYKRAYLPKGETFRPLGVPKAEWRVAMHMVSNFLCLFLRNEISSYNHGFMPGLGTGTAIKDFILRGLRVKYIYEFDFKQFFPRVDSFIVSTLLLKRKVNKEFVEWLAEINNKFPELPDKLELPFDEVIKNTKKKSDENDLSYFEDWGAAVPWANFQMLGLPQGLNTSPILSIFSIIDWVEGNRWNGIEPTMYADDGHLMSYKDFKPEAPEYHEFNEEKSRWIKRPGMKTKVVKYLGLMIDLDKGTIEGNTRSGKTLKFDARAENLVELIAEMKLEKQEESPTKDESRLENIITSGLWGFVMSKLYNGTWENLTAKERKWKQHKNSWWVKTFNKRYWNVKRNNKIKHRGLSSKAVNVLIEVIKRSKET